MTWNFPRRAYNIHVFLKIYKSNNLDERKDHTLWHTMVNNFESGSDDVKDSSEEFGSNVLSNVRVDETLVVH